jgi:thiosulfate oxidation carrier complex protein SoxZ
MQHPMETGQRKDDKGQTLPMHFIQTFTVSHNGKPMIDGQLNTSISKNPLFAFKARGIKVGDKISGQPGRTAPATSGRTKSSSAKSTRRVMAGRKTSVTSTCWAPRRCIERLAHR